MRASVIPPAIGARLAAGRNDSQEIILNRNHVTTDANHPMPQTARKLRLQVPSSLRLSAAADRER